MMKSILKSVRNVCGLVALGLVPMLVVLSGLKVAAPDGTIVWEFPEARRASVEVRERVPAVRPAPASPKRATPRAPSRPLRQADI